MILVLTLLLASLQFCGWSVESGEPVWMPVYSMEQLQPELDRLIRRRNAEALAELRLARRPPESPVVPEVSDLDPPSPSGTAGIVWRPSVERWRTLVDRYFTGRGESERALAIIRCESMGDPDAVNPSSGTSGLFQMRMAYWLERAAAAGVSGASVFDAESNIRVAAWLVHHGGGWRHWSGAAWGVDSCLEWALAQGV
ncbi:MAG: transglycosylase SLT domain-containing protein [Planctomycetota bacterium]